MSQRHYVLFVIFATLLLLGGSRYFIVTRARQNNAPIVTSNSPTPTPQPTISPEATPEASPPSPPSPSPKPAQKPQAPTTSISFLRMIKDVGEPQYDNFGLTGSDFQAIKDAGFNVIGVNFDICAGDKDVRYLLETAHKYSLKVVMPAGSGEAEWGYECDAQIPQTQGPVWLKDKVQQWVNKWKSYPAVYAWDISNEAGLNFPNGENNPNIGQNWVKFALTADQLKTAHDDVKAVDKNHPILIRMSGFWFYENGADFFRQGNAFANNVADIVMVNAYSNILDEYDETFVTDITTKANRSIREIDSDVKLVIALASWQEGAQWKMPSLEHLTHDFQQVKQYGQSVNGIAYFKYGASTGQDWLLPDANRGNPELWAKVKQLNSISG